MKTYIYTGISDFFYHDVCLAQLGDILEIGQEGIRNVSNKNKFSKAPAEIIEDILKDCEEYDPESSIDSEETDFTLSKELNNSSIRSFFFLNEDVITKLISLGILKTCESTCRDHNVGKSNYAQHVIQPWAIWQDYNLNPWDADIVKRILRTKEEEGMSETEARILDYEKIIHICQERVRQLTSNK